ncbi:MAG: hypothetical protein LBC61_07355 [Candidatus Peribacteria bacterium]|jgi:hypothetical protein|nr:hypothetical protein [Candidatus Peribacteria bacterium]
MLSALDKFNQGTTMEKSAPNFIINSFNNTLNKLKSELKYIKDDVI